MYQHFGERIWIYIGTVHKVIHLMRPMIDYYRARKYILHMRFINLERYYDKALRNLIWWAMLNKGIPC